MISSFVIQSTGSRSSDEENIQRQVEGNQRWNEQQPNNNDILRRHRSLVEASREPIQQQHQVAVPMGGPSSANAPDEKQLLQPAGSGHQRSMRLADPDDVGQAEDQETKHEDRDERPPEVPARRSSRGAQYALISRLPVRTSLSNGSHQLAQGGGNGTPLRLGRFTRPPLPPPPPPPVAPSLEPEPDSEPDRATQSLEPLLMSQCATNGSDPKLVAGPFFAHQNRSPANIWSPSGSSAASSSLDSAGSSKFAQAAPIQASTRVTPSSEFCARPSGRGFPPPPPPPRGGIITSVTTHQHQKKSHQDESPSSSHVGDQDRESIINKEPDLEQDLSELASQSSASVAPTIVESKLGAQTKHQHSSLELGVVVDENGIKQTAQISGENNNNYKKQQTTIGLQGTTLNPNNESPSSTWTPPLTRIELRSLAAAGDVAGERRLKDRARSQSIWSVGCSKERGAELSSETSTLRNRSRSIAGTSEAESSQQNNNNNNNKENDMNNNTNDKPSPPSDFAEWMCEFEQLQQKQLRQQQHSDSNKTNKSNNKYWTLPSSSTSSSNAKQTIATKVITNNTNNNNNNTNNTTPTAIANFKALDDGSSNTTNEHFDVVVCKRNLMGPSNSNITTANANTNTTPIGTTNANCNADGLGVQSNTMDDHEEYNQSTTTGISRDLNGGFNIDSDILPTTDETTRVIKNPTDDISKQPPFTEHELVGHYSSQKSHQSADKRQQIDSQQHHHSSHNHKHQSSPKKIIMQHQQLASSSNNNLNDSTEQIYNMNMNNSNIENMNNKSAVINPTTQKEKWFQKMYVQMHPKQINSLNENSLFQAANSHQPNETSQICIKLKSPKTDHRYSPSYFNEEDLDENGKPIVKSKVLPGGLKQPGSISDYEPGRSSILSQQHERNLVSETSGYHYLSILSHSRSLRTLAFSLTLLL